MYMLVKSNIVPCWCFVKTFKWFLKKSNWNVFGNYTLEKREGFWVSCQYELKKRELQGLFGHFLLCPCYWLCLRKKQRASGQGGSNHKKAKPTFSDPVPEVFSKSSGFSWSALQSAKIPMQPLCGLPLGINCWLPYPGWGQSLGELGEVSLPQAWVRLHSEGGADTCSSFWGVTSFQN